MDAVEEIKARLNIEELVGRHVELKRSGASLKGLCPFHAEKTPSFYVFPARQTFRCFGCGVGGDIFTFAQNINKIDFRAALVDLAARANVELPNERARVVAAEANDRLFALNEATVEFFREQLAASAGTAAREYLSRRNVTPAIQHSFGIGFAPGGKHSLMDSLTKRGFTIPEMLQAGVIRQVDGDNDPRDRFHDRLMIPIRDRKGRTTGFGGRILGSGEPKYLNSPQTRLFDKSLTLFGIDKIPADPRLDTLVVVEGYLDAIRAHAHGYLNVVASLGTAITDRQLLLCSRLAPVVVLALDPDSAGQSASARAAISALAALPRRQKQLSDALGRGMVDVGLSVDLRIARLPEDAGDPDELIERDASQWEAVVNSGVPAFDFYFGSVMNSVDKSLGEWRQVAIDQIMPVIKEFPFALGVQAAWIERLAEDTGIQTRLLQAQLGAQTSRSGRDRRAAAAATTTQAKPQARDPSRSILENLLSVLLTHPCPSAVAPALRELDLTGPARELIDRCIESSGNYSRAALEGLSTEGKELAERAQKLAIGHVADDRLEPVIRLHLGKLRQARIRDELREIETDVKELAVEDQEQARKRLRLILEELQDLDRQVQVFQVQAYGGRIDAPSDKLPRQ
jgi:DNA primase